MIKVSIDLHWRTTQNTQRQQHFDNLSTLQHNTSGFCMNKHHLYIPQNNDVSKNVYYDVPSTSLKKSYLLAFMAPGRTLNIHGTVLLHKRFFTVEKGSLDY